jgi:hypothetical protein
MVMTMERQRMLNARLLRVKETLELINDGQPSRRRAP